MAVAAPAPAASYFDHPGTKVRILDGTMQGVSKPDNVKKRIMRKAGYEKVSGNAWKKLSWLSKFNYFSSGSRNMHSTARAYYESGHLLTASILRETVINKNKDKAQKKTIEEAENETWTGFKDCANIQEKCKRQDFVTHRTHMLESGDKTTTPSAEATEKQANDQEEVDQPLFKKQTTQEPTGKTQNNRFSRIATKLSRVFMSACECTSAPTGFTFRALRNFVFHGVSDKGIIHKGATAASTIFIGLGVSSIIKAIRGAAGTSGYGFNPIQILTGVLVAFAAVSGIAGGLSWISGLASQAAMKNIDPSDEQKKFIQYEMNSTLNKVNELLLQYKDNPTMIKMIDRAMSTEFPSEKLERLEITGTIKVSGLLATWLGAMDGIKDIKGYENDPKKGVKLSGEAQKKALEKAKDAVGQYLLKETGSNGPTDQTLSPTKKALIFCKEKEFAALAGLVEHYETEESEGKPEQIKTDSKDSPAPTEKTQHLRKDRIDGRQFTEEFAQQMNRTLLTALATPARLLDMVFKTKTEKTLTHYADKNYTKNRNKNLGAPEKAGLHKYHVEYIADHLHQYGRITRALIKASNFIHDINYHYVLAVNAQTSRLYNKAAQAFQESVLGQHSSKIACSAFGRFMGGMTVTLVSFLGISALAHLTGGGSAASGFQNSSQIGSAKLSWLITGTLMTVVGLPAFALGLLAKGAAMAEGWRGDIDAPVTQEMHAKQKKSEEQNLNNLYLVYV